MYSPGPSQEELDLLGLTIDDVEVVETTDVWPENWSAVKLFCELRTQWQVGMAGPTGLNYAVVPTVIDLIELEFDEDQTRREVFKQVQYMEYEALDLMAKQAKKSNRT